MADRKRIMLYFGSFNPIHKGHIAIAEHVIGQDLADEVVLIVSPQNPLKETSTLAPDFNRFEMAELAVAASRFPASILVSIIEMTLPRPSYTIDTLRHLSDKFPQTDFSVLVGGDIVEQLEQWKEHEAILDGYNMHVYPRPNQKIERHLDRITVLKDAPQFDISSTEIREAVRKGGDINDMVPHGVAQYIRKNGLFK